jgi:hypothetical protein
MGKIFFQKLLGQNFFSIIIRVVFVYIDVDMAMVHKPCQP